MPDDSAPRTTLSEIETGLLIGVMANERFVAQSKQTDQAWREGTLGDLVNQMRKQAADEYDNGPSALAEPAAHG